MVVIISGVGGNELYVLYGQGGSELPSVTALVTIAISMYFMIIFVLCLLNRICTLSIVTVHDQYLLDDFG